MVLLFQVVVFLLILAFRGRRLLGWHLGRVKGVPGRVKATYYDTKGHIVGLHVGVDCGHEVVPFVVRKERWYHKYFKQIGLATEVAIPDAAFDERYFITTDFPSHLEGILRDGPLIKLLKEMMRLRISAVHASSGKVWCVVEGPAIRFNDAHFNVHHRRLAAIGEAARADRQVRLPGFGRKKLLAALFLAVHGMLFTCGLLGYLAVADSSIDTVDNKVIVGVSLLAGVAVVAVWSGLVMLVFRRTSWFAWVMADFLLWGLAGVMLMGGQEVREANIKLEQPLVVREQPVLGKECVLKCVLRCGSKCSRREEHKFRGDANCALAARQSVLAERLEHSEICRYQARYSYTVFGRSWRPAEGLEGYRMEVSQPVFDHLKTGGTVKVPVHGGALGMEWVDMKEVSY